MRDRAKPPKETIVFEATGMPCEIAVKLVACMPVDMLITGERTVLA